ncbi:MAG TPA: hypothetical protein PK995_07990 [Bacteroidia bacterium]|nr:hypothetical protein [Bacteroidia bacterium]
MRNLQGNTLAVYEVKLGAVADSLFVKEFNIYGTERIGYMQELNYINKKCNTPLCSTITLNNPIGANSTMKTLPTSPPSISPLPVTPTFTTFLGGSGSGVVNIYYGKKRYELSDWLGNVRVVVSDKKVPDNVSGNVVLNYKPEVLSIRDYYAFGSEINERTFEPIKPKYRYGFNTQEKVFEINKDHYTARYWEYDSRLGRRWNVDPKPDANWSMYSVLYDNPIINIDVFGDKPLDDYKIRKDGKIERIKTNDNFDRFYVEDKDSETGFKLLATLEKNEYNLVKFPNEGVGFNRYGIEDKGGVSINPNETVGKGDHYLKPETAAALFGLTYYLNKEYGFVISLGDMSSSNGSDPWQPGQRHHKGHGHLGKRIGLDVDFRYLDVTGKKGIQSSNAFEEKIFSQQNNQIIFDNAKKFGFGFNYQGSSGNIKGVKKDPGHNDHGHLGLDYNILKLESN